MYPGCGSYHQKYLLRKHDWLVAALGLEDDNKMISSHVAARINGYIGGDGDEGGSAVGILETYHLFKLKFS